MTDAVSETVQLLVFEWNWVTGIRVDSRFMLLVRCQYTEHWIALSIWNVTTLNANWLVSSWPLVIVELKIHWIMGSFESLSRLNSKYSCSFWMKMILKWHDSCYKFRNQSNSFGLECIHLGHHSSIQISTYFQIMLIENCTKCWMFVLLWTMGHVCIFV